MTIRVLVADDHPIIRSGVIAILAENRDIEIVAEAASGRETLDALKKHVVDVLVLDLKMPEGGGFDVLAQIATWPKRPKVVVLSHYAEEHFAIQALHAGASGYLPKEAAPDQLVKAVRRVHAGGRYVTEALADQLVDVTDPARTKAPHEHLSPREFQVFMALASGKKTQNIATDLGISLSTAHTLRRHVHEKLGVDSDVDLARYAMALRLVD
jgi:two-component system invasion response regulator UvrY